MKICIPYYFNKFNCIAGDCESTCCANWEVVIDNKSFKKYESVEGGFKDILKKNLIKNSEGENIFLFKKDRCSFLNKNNTCDLYINLGKDSLCYTCSTYPRFIEEFLDLKEIGLSLSCPEACRLILKEDCITKFIIKETDEKFIGDPSSFDKEFLNYLLKSRALIFKIIDLPDLPLNKKIHLALSFVDDLQCKIDSDLFDEIDKTLKFYEDSFSTYSTFSTKESFNSYNEIILLFNSFKELKQLNNIDSLKILDTISFIEQNTNVYLEKRTSFIEYFNENIYMFKNIFVYLIFRYFLKSFFDFNPLSKLKLAIVNTIVIYELSYINWLKTESLDIKDFTKILYTFSKSIEHLEENINTLESLFEENTNFSISNLIHLVYFIF